MLRKKFVGVQITCTASLQECNFSHINLPLPKSDGVIYPRIYSVKSHYKKKKSLLLTGAFKYACTHKITVRFLQKKDIFFLPRRKNLSGLEEMCVKVPNPVFRSGIKKK